MRLPCIPLISKAWTGVPSNTNDNRSDTSVFGFGATAIWNSNVVGSVISTSSSAATSRLDWRSMRDSLSSMLVHARFQDRQTDAIAFFTFGRVSPQESPQTKSVPLPTVHAACTVVRVGDISHAAV